MPAPELAAAVRETLTVDEPAFRSTARSEAEELKAAVQQGTFDNRQTLVGLELELYGVDDRTGALRRIPRRLLELAGFEPELGLHNAEMQTAPQPLTAHGLDAKRAELQAHLASALDEAAAENVRLVADGIWTVPPDGERAEGYLTDCAEQDGIRIATNMSEAVRYHALANAGYPSNMAIDAPHVSLQAGTIMPESLLTSIQPHYQVAHARELPEHFRYALRVAAPLLALGVNSPFFPPDLYDDTPDADIVADAHMEHRIGVFESVLNPPEGATEPPKVRFPPDFSTVGEAIDDVADDVCIVPQEVTPSGRFDDAFVHFRHKHGSYWRWVRPVFEAPSRSSANVRIEFRPIPAQPTIGDCVAFSAVFAGLMERLPGSDHPVGTLDWEVAERNFYRAASDGLEADLRWITADGTETTAIRVICGECLSLARDGLERQGLSAGAAARHVRPLQDRLDRQTTPARWKHDRVTASVEENVPLAEAIREMQAAYLDCQRETLIEGSFADWL